MNMIQDILLESEKNKINENYIKALKDFSKAVNNLKPKEKHSFILPLKTAGFSFSRTKELGFLVSKYLWKNCSVICKREKGITFK